jgi:hypothetical protein
MLLGSFFTWVYFLLEPFFLEADNNPNINITAVVDLTAMTLAFASDVVLEPDADSAFCPRLSILGLDLGEQEVMILSQIDARISFSGELHNIDSNNEIFVYGQIVDTD